MKMHCPHCGVKGSVDDSYIGRKVRCPKCQTVFHCEDEQQLIESPAFPESPEIPTEMASPIEEQTPGSEPEPWPDLSQPGEEQREDEHEWQAPADKALSDSKSEAVEATGGAADFGPDLKEEPEPEPAAAEVEAFVPPEVPLPDEPAPPAETEAAVLPDEPESEPEQRAEELNVSAPPEVPLADEPAPPAETEAAVLPDEPEQRSEELNVSTPPEVPPSTEIVPPAETEAAAISSSGGRVDEQPAAVATLPLPGPKPHPDFTVGEALTEAWRRTKGAKGTVWAAMGVMYLVMLALGFGLVSLQMSSGLDPESAGGVWLGIGIEALSSAVSTLFTAGLLYLGVCLAAGKNCSWKMVAAGFPAAVQLLIAAILMTLLVISGVVMLILPGIYLAVGYTLTLPLMLDRGLGPWEAMEKSRKAIHKVWWKVFGLFLVMGIITAVSAIPVGIGLIWTLPMNVVLCGVVYRYLFGVVGGRN